MKNLLSLLSLLALPNFAAALDLPPEPCAGVDCTPIMRTVADAFKSAHGLKPISLPAVASGNCLQPSNESEPNFHAVMLIDLQNSAYFLATQFSSGQSENPFRSWNLSQARSEFPDRFHQNKQMEFGINYSFQNSEEGEDKGARYWLRQQRNTFYILSDGGPKGRILCYLQRHQ